MLTGEVAFPVPKGLEARRVAIHIMTEKQQIECLDPGDAYKDDLRSLVRCLTQRDPRKRPASALAVLALLESLDPRCNPEATTLIRDGRVRSFVEVLGDFIASTEPASGDLETYRELLREGAPSSDSERRDKIASSGS